MHWLTALGAVPILSAADTQPNTDPDYTDEEAYRVYSTLIPQNWVWQEAKAESLVIATQTVSSEMCLEPEGESAPILAAAIANYKDLATKKWTLQRQFSLMRPYVLVDQQELARYFSRKGSGWKAFYAKYPKSGGYLFLSPVGFNSTKNVAVVQINHSCGPLCGGGEYSVLQKRDGAWKPLDWKGGTCGWFS